MTILLIGMCGSGKTWVMQELIKNYNLSKRKKLGMIYYHTDDSIMVLGKYDGSMYQGSDKLSMAVISDLEQFLNYATDKIIIAEGDRFTNSKFINKANPIIIKIIDNGEAGRKKRNSTQSERHLKSIQTRVNNIEADHYVETSNDALFLIKYLTDKFITYGK
jgi:tRNA A37 threonylcarbamoyladenosine biosynthesis protein TsaE